MKFHITNSVITEQIQDTQYLCAASLFLTVRKQEHMNDSKNEAKCTVEKLGILLFLEEL